MGSEATAVDRIDAVHSRLEQYLENLSAKRVFRDKLEIRGAWKDKPIEVFDLVREVAADWRTVEMADE